jgi:hypothetical protein
MKNLSLLLIAFFTISFSAIAQNGKVVLCEDYNKTDGTPTGVNKNWDIDKETGSYVYVIYSQDAIIKDKLMLYVDKKNDNGNLLTSYIAFDIKKMTGFSLTQRQRKKNGQCMTINLQNPVITEFQ